MYDSIQQEQNVRNSIMVDNLNSHRGIPINFVSDWLA